MTRHCHQAHAAMFRAVLQHRAVFIDGNVDCYNTSWRILIGVVVILCFVPIAFAGALLRNKLPVGVIFPTSCQAPALNEGGEFGRQ